MINIYSNGVLLQLIFPLIFGIYLILCFNKNFAWLCGLLFALIVFIVSSLLFVNFPLQNVKYNFGSWPRDLGIEYSVSQLGQFLICVLNFILLFFISHKNFLNSNIFRTIDHKRIGIFFSILFFAHFGYVGILSTNDFFNLYVFIEISSLASYALVAQGRDKRSLIASYDYLLTGTLGATFILIAIGFIFSSIGSLNIDEVFLKFSYGFSQYKMFYAGIIFFILGFLMKIAFFPLHFWVMRVYSFSNILIVIYVSSVSTVVGVFWIIKFSYLLFDNIKINSLFLLILQSVVLVFILFSNIASLFSKKFLRILVFSGSANIGFILIMTIHKNYYLASYFLVTDILNKMLLFSLMLLFPELSKSNLDSIKISYKNPIFQLIIFVMFLFISGLPISNMFFIKLGMLEFLIKKNLLLEVGIFSLSFSLSFLYFFKIFQIFMIKQSNSDSNHNDLYDKFPIFFVLLIQIILLIFSELFKGIHI